MFPYPDDPRTLTWFTALNFNNHPRTASDREVVIEVPLLVSTPVGCVCNEGAILFASGDVQDKTETGGTYEMHSHHHNL